MPYENLGLDGRTEELWKKRARKGRGGEANRGELKLFLHAVCETLR
jgi:hypothetical protein